MQLPNCILFVRQIKKWVYRIHSSIAEKSDNALTTNAPEYLSS